MHRATVEVFHINPARTAHGEWSDAMMSDSLLLSPDKYDRVAVLKFVMAENSTPTSILRFVFKDTQNDTFRNGWKAHWAFCEGLLDSAPVASRSTSVGDLIRYKGVFFRVARAGFFGCSGPEMQPFRDAFPEWSPVVA